LEEALNLSSDRILNDDDNVNAFSVYGKWNVLRKLAELYQNNELVFCIYEVSF
jgi:hypothetical protein